MALIYFQKEINIASAELPSPGGYVIAYDQDGVLKQKDSDGNISELGKGLTVVDFLTGNEFQNVRNVTFRGGSVTTPSGDVNGATVIGEDENVTVWIPAPEYVRNFNPTLYSEITQRYISNPSNNTYTLNVEKGSYDINDWDVTTDFGNVTRSVMNDNSIKAFEDLEFSCINENTTMDFILYDGNDNILLSITDFLLEENNSETDNGLIITVNSFNPDSDRFKASVTGDIVLDTILPNGGRFKYEVIHRNGSDGDYTFTSEDLFRDFPTPQDGSNSTSLISGDVTFSENAPSLKYYSGVAFYDMGSTFDVSVEGIDNINELTTPTDKQIDVIANNMPISSTHDGIGSDIDGWSIDWDSTQLTYSPIASVDEENVYIPSFTNGNTLSTNSESFFVANIYDYGLSDTKDSNSLLMLFDTAPEPNNDLLNNDITSEDGRLKTDDIQLDGDAVFDSNLPLTQDELQYIFGRIIYPTQDFTSFYPNINLSASNIDYTNSNAVNKVFDVYSDLSTGDIDNVLLEDYRWYTTSYEKSSSFSNGIFVLNSNFEEEDLHFNGINSTNGNEDLVILIGIDSSGNNTTPDSFLFVSGDPNLYPSRQNSITYNFDKSNSSKDIQFSKGTLTSIVRKVWLLIGFKNSTRGKELYLSNISLQ
jgi:hypothetical protein